MASRQKAPTPSRPFPGRSPVKATRGAFPARPGHALRPRRRPKPRIEIGAPTAPRRHHLVQSAQTTRATQGKETCPLGATAAMAEEGVVVLRCFDGVKLAVPTALATQRSGLVADAVAAGVRVVDVPGNVSGHVVAKVVTYWEAHGAIVAAGAEVAVFDAGFLVGLRHDARVDLIHAAHHLGDAALFDLFRFGT
ncbi:uncharacterized protein LOC133903210 [Phragmites australis]|uniref:uncharacterized protein LOC133903210 n=1 Tax=Phragmites australis TaxID=29695 RepID=UPI002D775B6A|nr:uncharacterized protein LOC133903210 [Phragmites australis]